MFNFRHHDEEKSQKQSFSHRDARFNTEEYVGNGIITNSRIVATKKT